MTATNNRSDLLAALTEGISKLTTSEEWERYLDCQSRFYHYSSNNVMLILAQRHDATQIAGFSAWKKFGRFVKKGEKAIWIVAPMRYTVSDDEKTDDKQQVIRGFKWVPVFDISSTDGEELPSVCNKLAGDDPDGLFDRLTAVADSIGYHVEKVSLDGHTNGDCTYSEKRIRVEATNAPAQRVKTLAHELAHALLHEGRKDRALAELEAESTAFIVCRALGIDTSDYSFGYVTTWAGGGDQAIAGITASCQNIQKAAATILGSFEVRDSEEAA